MSIKRLFIKPKQATHKVVILLASALTFTCCNSRLNQSEETELVTNSELNPLVKSLYEYRLGYQQYSLDDESGIVKGVGSLTKLNSQVTTYSKAGNIIERAYLDSTDISCSHHSYEGHKETETRMLDDQDKLIFTIALTYNSTDSLSELRYLPGDDHEFFNCHNTYRYSPNSKVVSHYSRYEHIVGRTVTKYYPRAKLKHIIELDSNGVMIREKLVLFDDNGQKTKIIVNDCSKRSNPNDLEIKLFYNEKGKLIQKMTTNNNGLRTSLISFDYDSLERKSTVIHNWQDSIYQGHKEIFEYDVNGNCSAIRHYSLSDSSLIFQNIKSYDRNNNCIEKEFYDPQSGQTEFWFGSYTYYY